MSRPAILALALLAAAAPALAAAVAPGTVEMRIGEPGTLTPGRARTTDVVLRYCAAAGGPLGGPQHVTLASEAPAWLRVEFEPASHAFATLLPGECQEARGRATFNASRDAPALEMGRVVVAARAADGTIARTAEVFARVGFLGDLRVTAPRNVAAPPGEAREVRVVVQNLGNAATTFQLATAGAREDVHVALPEPLVLEPGASGEWKVTVLLPRGRDAADLDLLVTSHAHLDHTARGASELVRVRVHAAGSAAAASGDDAPAEWTRLAGDVGLFAVVGVLGAVLGVREVRRRPAP